MCTEYKLRGSRLTEVPLDMADLSQVKPVYKTMPGWKCDTTGTTAFDALPVKARDYLNVIAVDLGVAIRLISTGAKRVETIFV
jgi:adenylosuccinate synthase